MFGLWVDKLWPWKGETKWAGPLLRESFMHEEQETFPVPVGLYEDIFQKDFWEYRRRFAATPLEMRTVRDSTIDTVHTKALTSLTKDKNWCQTES